MQQNVTDDLAEPLSVCIELNSLLPSICIPTTHHCKIAPTIVRFPIFFFSSVYSYDQSFFIYIVWAH